MNWRMLLIFSLGVNVLLAALAVKRASSGGTPAPESAGTESQLPTSPEVRTVTQEVVVTNTLPAAALDWPRWSDWASEDWGELRTNLLAAGCPGITIREILRASLQRARFAEQQPVRASVDGVLWETLARHGFDDEAGPIKQAVEELDAIDRRYDELINMVLKGLPSNDEIENAGREQRNRERQFDHLEPALRQQAADMVAEFDRQRNELTQANLEEQGLVTPQGTEAILKLGNEHKTALGTLMGAKSAAEWRLRTSGNAEWAAQLRGLEVTSEEMRQLAEFRSSLSASVQGREGTSPEREHAEQAMNDKLRELLGNERFATTQRANQQNGGTYVALFDIAERFELPSNVIEQGMAMQHAANAAANQIRANEQLTAAQRREGLRAIQQETRQAAEGLLGVDAFYTYQRHGGDWINGLSSLNAGR